MLLGELTDAIILDDLVFRVSSKNVSLESRVSDSGVKVRLYGSHPAIMYYFVRFGSALSRHHITGPTNVSAFTFDDTNRAFVSIRLSVDGVRPLPMVDEEGNLIPTLATRVRVRDFPRDQGFLKMKFIIFKYVLENIDNQEKVAGRGDNIDKFAGQVSDMYVNLLARNLIGEELNPVAVMETISRPEVDARNRPLPRVMRTTYGYNHRIARTDWEHPSLTFAQLADDSVPFDNTMFALPP